MHKDFFPDKMEILHAKCTLYREFAERRKNRVSGQVEVELRVSGDHPFG